MAQLAPGWIAAPVRIDGDGAGGAVLCVGATGAALLIAGAVGVVMTGVAVVVGG